MRPVPRDGEREAVFERHPRRITQLGDLAVVQRVPQIMATATRIDDVLHVIPAAPSRVEQQLGELLVRQLLTAADVVDLARQTLLDDQLNPSAVIGDEQPVPYVESFAVKRHFLTVEQVGDEQRNDL